MLRSPERSPAYAVGSIPYTAENILIPGGPQERCHHIIEEAYVALGLIEPQVDKLRAELEYQHTRLDELREAALAEIIQDPE